MVADDKDKPAFSYFLSLNLLEIAGYRLQGRWAGSYQSGHFCSFNFDPCTFPIYLVSVQELWWCVSFQGSVTDSCCVSSPPAAAKASWETWLLSWMLKELMCLSVAWLSQEISPWGLWGSDSLFSASRLLHTPCVYLEQTKGAGSDESPGIFSVLPQIRLSVFPAMPLVTCWRSYFCAFLVNLCTPVLLFSHVFVAVLFLLYVLDTANEETDFKEGLCFFLNFETWSVPCVV